MTFVNLILDPYGAFLYRGEAQVKGGGGGEPLCKPACFEDIDFKSEVWEPHFGHVL